MSWTDERVERLSRLWLEGLSASQIAADLGEGVTRNAVIGKVHRLGLSGRTTAAAGDVPPACELPPTASAAPPSLAEAGETDTDGDLAAADAPSDPPVAIDFAPMPVAIDLSALRSRDAALPQTERVTILELGATMCRWPLGDPTTAEFRFCGCRATSGLPYCPEHARVAFQPVTDRRRVERMVRLA